MITLCGFAVSNYFNIVKQVLLEKEIAFTEEHVTTGSKDAAVVITLNPGAVHRADQISEERIIRRGTGRNLRSAVIHGGSRLGEVFLKNPRSLSCPSCLS